MIKEANYYEPAEFLFILGLMLVGGIVGYLGLKLRKQDGYGLFIPAHLNFILWCFGYRILEGVDNWNYWMFGLSYLLLALLAWVGYRKIYCFDWPQEGSRNYVVQIDGFTVGALLAPLSFIMGRGLMWPFVGWMLLATWFMLPMGRLPESCNKERVYRGLLTGVTLSVMLGLLQQAICRVPDMYMTEAVIGLLIGSMVILRFVIWKQAGRPALDILLFMSSCLAVMVQGIQALITGNVFDSLVLLFSALGMLVLGYKATRRSWFILGNITILAITIQKTSDFWQDIAWWVYLLFAGVLCILLAAQNERYRQSGTSIGKKVSQSDFFTNWKW